MIELDIQNVKVNVLDPEDVPSCPLCSNPIWEWELQTQNVQIIRVRDVVSLAHKDCDQ